REEKLVVKVDKWVALDVVDKIKVQVMVAHWVDEQRVVTSYHPETKLVAQDVVKCRLVPVCYIDPCTCCPYTVMKPENYVERVQYTVCEYRAVQSPITVKV